MIAAAEALAWSWLRARPASPIGTHGGDGHASGLRALHRLHHLVHGGALVHRRQGLVVAALQPHVEHPQLQPPQPRQLIVALAQHIPGVGVDPHALQGREGRVEGGEDRLQPPGGEAHGVAVGQKDPSHGVGAQGLTGRGDLL